MNKLQSVQKKEKKLVIGIMSGTSADGIDTVIAEIQGFGTSTKVRQVAFITSEFPDSIRKRILEVASGEKITAEEFCCLDVVLGKLYAKSCIDICEQASISTNEIDFVGCHGQTIHHQPSSLIYHEIPVIGSLQIGDPSQINAALGCPVVSNFRKRDMASGGQGAPLVPYVDFLLYRNEHKSVALQNIGGIGNITILPAGCRDISQLTAFDTGPGNMIIDDLVNIFTGGKSKYDNGGKLAGIGVISNELLDFLMDDKYLTTAPPKSTGREYYGADFIKKILEKSQELSLDQNNILATVTYYTAKTISYSIKNYCKLMPDIFILGGGGAHNDTMTKFIKKELPNSKVIKNEDLGFDSDSKEALAFAVLANETIHVQPSNVPAATGADKTLILGEISF